ncbi:hypothetical protein DYB32_003108 [Aphanomyces invadans]|uniref:Hsp70-like protein n=1 Tax=Aphanomyces invadans TaxID=157072 RepID=A0A3R7ABQ1_9STRA|nr:hypothetical protein DYB32_003108 [Aphanomyces invadans]
MVNAGTVLFFVSAVFGAIAVFLARSGHLGKEHLVGIDLGTTYSVVAVNRHGNVTVMPDVHGHLLLPSVVAFKPNGAEAALYDFPLLANTTGDSHVCFGLNLPGHPSCISPVDIGYYVVKALKETAMAFLGHDQVPGFGTFCLVRVCVTETCPDASQRKATVAAFERAGLKVRNVLVEPTAAALAYGLHTKPNVHYVLVFDFGGGTLDVSLLYLQNGSFQVMDTAGDNHLGGREPPTSGDMPDVFPCTAAGVRGVAEQLKRRLSFANDGEASCVVQQAVGEYVVGDTLRLRMTRAEWEELCLPTLQRTMEPVKEVLVGNMMTAGDVDEVVLVGGSSRIPWIQGQLTEMFGRAPNGHIDPDVAVAVGAARLAH